MKKGNLIHSGPRYPRPFCGIFIDADAIYDDVPEYVFYHVLPVGNTRIEIFDIHKDEPQPIVIQDIEIIELF